MVVRILKNFLAQSEVAFASKPKLPCVNTHRCKVQLVFGLEEKSLAPDLHYRGWLEGCGYDKKSQLRVGQGPIFRQLVLPMEIFQPPLEVKGLCGKGKDIKSHFSPMRV